MGDDKNNTKYHTTEYRREEGEVEEALMVRSASIRQYSQK